MLGLRKFVKQTIKHKQNVSVIAKEVIMSVSAVITQSNYIPWKGYFDLVAAADYFVIYDEVQYTRRDWRNRNSIKTPSGLAWLTIPVESKGKFNQSIADTSMVSSSWREQHWKTIERNYKKSTYFNEISSWLKPLIVDNSVMSLSTFNIALISGILEYLNIATEVRLSSEFPKRSGRTEKLIDICVALDVNKYISGPSAKDYIKEETFIRSGIGIEWFDYSGYPTYTQLWGEFEHNVSIIDLLFNCGSNSPKYMKHKLE